MSLTRLVCPHCEKTVTMQLTEVARMRECPECGKTIMLQFVTNGGGASKSRRALLLPQEKVEEAQSKNDAILLPRSLEGNIQERMLHDPEVKTSASMLKSGLIAVLGLVILLVAGNYFSWWEEAAKGIDVLKNKLTAPSAGIDPGAKHDVLVHTKPETEGDPRPASEETENTIPQFREPSIEPPEAQNQPKPTPQPTIRSTGDPNTDAAVQAVKNFLEADSVAKRLDMVRDKELMESKMRRYYEDYPDGPMAYLGIKQVGNTTSGLTFIFDVVLANGEERRATVGKTVSGSYLVDWASFVIYSEKKWADFIESKTKDATSFRVLGVQENFYSGYFADESRLGCLKLVDPVDRSSPPLYAYYERSTILGREMEFIMRQSLGQAVPLILTLRYPDGNVVDDRQVWITERLAEGWVARGL